MAKITSLYDCSLRLPRSASRRDILRAAILSLGFVALGPFGRRSEALGAPRPNFKRLIVINMVGGCDTLNMIIPNGLSAYHTARANGNLAIQPAQSLTLNGTSLTMHPSMPRIRSLWNTGDALAVQRVGYPQEDLSHFISSDVYSYGVRDSFIPLHVNKSGWVARYADNYATSALGAVSVGMGRPLDFVGGVAHGLTVSSLSGLSLVGATTHPERVEVVKSIIHNAPTAGLTYEAKEALSEAYDLADQVQAAVASHNAYLATAPVTWPTSLLAQHLKDAAALVYGGFDTRVFYTGFGGFDTHTGQGTVNPTNGSHPFLLAQLDDAIGAFADEMKLLGVWDDVAIVVITEFGRRTYSNGSGTDHGAAFAELVCGGSVKGGASYGPDLTNNDLAASLGYLTYEVDFRSVYKELLRDHLGVDPAPVFPEAQSNNVAVDIA